MKLWTAWRNATLGWLMLLRGEPGWRARFALTAPGLTTALVAFALMAFLAVVVTSIGIGMPSLLGLIAAMVVLALPLLAMVLMQIGTRKVLRSHEPMLDLLVPATYALTAFVLIEGLLAMLGGPVVMLAWLGLAWLLYKLARVTTGWNAVIAAGFAVLTVILLVALRLALYMLNSSAGSPI